jgi:hypothetical protein
MVAIVNRAGWGAQFTIPGGRHVAPSARRWFVVHWPGSPVAGDERAVVRAIERSHRQGQGWQAAPGYNFLVGRSGTIYEGCGRDVRGIHSPPRNTDGWGVCCMIAVGEQPPQAMLNATRALYEWLCTVAGRRLGMACHNTHFATACPGPALTTWVRNGMPAIGGGTPAPAPQPPPGPARPAEFMPNGEEPVMHVVFGEDNQAGIGLPNNVTHLRLTCLQGATVHVQFPSTSQATRAFELHRTQRADVQIPSDQQGQVILRQEDAKGPVYLAWIVPASR